MYTNVEYIHTVSINKERVPILHYISAPDNLQMTLTWGQSCCRRLRGGFADTVDTKNTEKLG